MALTLAAAAPAEAQSRYRDNNDNDGAKNALIGAAIGGLAGALFGNGDGATIAGGALAGAALGAATGADDENCGYRRGGRCYRNEGHWEREHGINSRDPRYGYSYDRDYGRRQDRRDYRYDRRCKRSQFARPLAPSARRTGRLPRCEAMGRGRRGQLSICGRPLQRKSEFGIV